MNEKDFESYMEPVSIFDATTHTNSEWDDEIYATWGHVPVEVRRLASIVTAWPEEAADAVRMASGSGFYWRGGYFINDENAQVADKAQWERARELYLAQSASPPDWGKAPEGATHFDPRTVSVSSRWLRLDKLKDCFWVEDKSKWHSFGYRLQPHVKDCLIPRPAKDEQQSAEIYTTWDDVPEDLQWLAENVNDQIWIDCYLSGEKRGQQPFLSADGSHYKFTREQWQRARELYLAKENNSLTDVNDTDVVNMDEQQSAEWNGEGLPPVGVECLLDVTRTITYEITPLWYSAENVVFKYTDSGAEQMSNIAWFKAKVRPIRTAEQQATDERDQFIQKAAKIMFDISGVIDDNSLGALFDEGCRLKDKD